MNGWKRLVNTNDSCNYDDVMIISTTTLYSYDIYDDGDGGDNGSR